MEELNGYLHLNDGDEWSTFELTGIEIADGALRLKQTSPGVFTNFGVFRGGPFQVADRPTTWFLLRMFSDALPMDAHTQLYTFTADSGDAAYDKTSTTPFAQAGWQKAPRDAQALVIGNSPAKLFWIGGVLRGQSATTPTVHQMRLDYGRKTLAEYLPPLYTRQDAPRDFLERLLALSGGVMEDVEAEIGDLVRLFNPASAPATGYPAWLPWLAGWLAFEWNDRWKDGEARSNLASAFELYGLRGTRDGLRRYIRMYTGGEVHIEEPILWSSPWILGENSSLGFSTMIAPAHWEGAVLDAAAYLDASVITRGDDPGEVLWADVAHRFCVWVNCADLNFPGALNAVRQVIDREKPAHTVYHLCPVEPRFRVGIQARVGIDSVIGAAAVAQTGMRLGEGVLGKEPEACRPQAGGDR
jgi:phage tail-like protein